MSEPPLDTDGWPVLLVFAGIYVVSVTIYVLTTLRLYP